MYELLRDITAGDLAMDSPDDEGYRAWDVIGAEGTTVTPTGWVDEGWVEVEGFSEDEHAIGFVYKYDMREV